jgi:hypothetical protein
MAHIGTLLKAAVLNEVQRCEMCGYEYRMSDLSVIADAPAMWLMRLDCHACADSIFVAAVLENGSAAAAEQALWRLRAGEAPETILDETIEPSEAVDDTDRQAMAAFLETFDGDFARLFREDG